MATYTEIITDQTLASDPFEKTTRLLELVGEPALAQEARELGQYLRDVAEGRVDVDQLDEADERRMYALADSVSDPLEAVCVPDPSPLVFWLENIAISLDELRTSERSADDLRIFRAEALEAPLDDLRPSLSGIEQDDLDAPSHGSGQQQGHEGDHSLG